MVMVILLLLIQITKKIIKIFTPSGQFLRKLGGEDLLVDPCHRIQKDQYFIVSDAGDHCIKVFNTDGDSPYKFGNNGDRDEGFEKRRWLSVDKAGHLMICYSDNNRVQRLELLVSSLESLNSE